MFESDHKHLWLCNSSYGWCNNILLGCNNVPVVCNNTFVWVDVHVVWEDVLADESALIVYWQVGEQHLLVQYHRDDPLASTIIFCSQILFVTGAMDNISTSQWYITIIMRTIVVRLSYKSRSQLYWAISLSDICKSHNVLVSKTHKIADILIILRRVTIMHRSRQRDVSRE